MTTLTTEEIRNRIVISGWSGCFFYCCYYSICEECPFKTDMGCGGNVDCFDFFYMKLGTETELKDLLKYKREGNNYEYPNLK